VELVGLGQQGNKNMKTYTFSYRETIIRQTERTLDELDGLKVLHVGSDGSRSDGGHIAVRGDTPFIEWDDGTESTNLNSLAAQTVTQHLKIVDA
jgi:hypothetical protein